MFCTNCGKIIPDDSSFCGYCGEHFNIYGTKEDIKSDNSHETLKENKINNKEKEDNDNLDKYDLKKENETIVFDIPEDKHTGTKKYCSVVDKIDANEESEAQQKSKHDTIEMQSLSNIPIDLFKVNKSIQQSVIPAGVKVINKYNKPFKTSTFFWTQVILLVPVLNIILLLVWAFRKHSNANRKAYARSILLWLLVFIFLLAIGIIILLAFGYPININYWINELKLILNNIPNI